mgnify:CR=1 FL=1
MIIDFTLKNFKSFKDEQTLSMLAMNSKDEHPGNVFTSPKEKKISLLKTAVIYGANASGKSNLIRAMKVLWFTGKDENSATKLYSLEEFNKNQLRKHTPYDDWYLSGRFGAVPAIDKNVFRK